MDSIDASIIGLQPTLQLLQQYYQSGILQADIGSALRRLGPSVAHIVIVEGNIVSCYVQSKTVQRQPVEIATLLSLDMDAGPFAWRFHPQQEQKQQTQTSVPVPARTQAQHSSQQLMPYAVPRRMAALELSWLTTWSPQQKRTLRMVYSMIDGRRTVATIERSVLLPNAIVQEALVILIAMQVVAIDSK